MIRILKLTHRSVFIEHDINEHIEKLEKEGFKIKEVKIFPIILEGYEIQYDVVIIYEGEK